MGIATLIPPRVGINPAESVVEVTKPPQNDYKMTSEELDAPAVACGRRCAPQQNTSIRVSAVLVSLEEYSNFLLPEAVPHHRRPWFNASVALLIVPASPTPLGVASIWCTGRADKSSIFRASFLHFVLLASSK